MFCLIPIPYICPDTTAVKHYEHHIGLDSRNSALLEPLVQGLSKLEDIRVRIGSRIDKEIASGTDMTIATGLLVTADNALDNSRAAVNIATSTVTDVHPRPGYAETQQAYFSLNQSRDALSAVLNAIETATTTVAHSPDHAQNNK